MRSSAAHRLLRIVLLVGVGVECAASESAGLDPSVTGALSKAASSLSSLHICWTRTRHVERPLPEVLSLLKYPPSLWHDQSFLMTDNADLIMRDERFRVEFQYSEPTVNSRAPNIESDFHAAPGRHDFTPLDSVTALRSKTGDPVARITGYHRFKTTLAFNGSHFFAKRDCLDDDLSPGSVIVKSREDYLDEQRALGLLNSERTIWRSDYLWYAGFSVPKRADELGRPLQSVVLMLAERSETHQVQRRENENQVDVTLHLSAGGKGYTFELDGSRSFAVRKMEARQPNGARIMTVLCQDIAEITKGAWLPRKVEVDYFQEFGLPEQPTSTRLFSESYELISVGAPPAGEMFELDYGKPGTHVSDDRLAESLGERFGFIVPASKGELDDAIRAAREGGAYTPLRSRRAEWHRWLLCLTVAGCVVALVFFVVKRWRRT